MGLLDTPPSGRPIYKRLTILAGTATAVLQALEPLGVVPPGSAAASNVVIASIVTMFATWVGVYRQISKD